MARGRLLFLTKYGRQAASVRQRTFQFLPFLEARGYACTVSPLFDDAYLRARFGGRRGRALAGALAGFVRRVRALRRAEAFDLAVVHCELLPYVPHGIERVLLGARVPYVLDFDDAIFHMYDQHARPAVRRVLGDKIRRVAAGARMVWAGSRYLADWARAANARVAVVPTVIDLDRYPAAPVPVDGEVFTIGWIGSPPTSPYLETLAAPLREFCSRHRARVRTIGAGAIRLEGVPVEQRAWEEATEIRDLQPCDVGIMPLPDTPWARGKCGFKLIQYMGCWRAVVASPVGANMEIVRPGENGFLAGSDAEWVAALETLRADPERRAAMGAAGRALVAAEYSKDATEPRIEALLEQALGARPVSAG